MKGLKKLALVSAIAAVSVGANAQLKPMSDTAMSAATGQAGLTIDVSVKMSIGEIAYKDGGYLTISDMSFGGAAAGSRFDNWRMTVDIANAGETLDYNTSALKTLYLGGNLQLNGVPAASIPTLLGAVATAATPTDFNNAVTAIKTAGYAGSTAQLVGWLQGAGGADNAKTYGDGDLVIHMAASTPLDGTDASGANPTAAAFAAKGAAGVLAGNFADALGDFSNAADFGFKIGQMALQSSDFGLGTTSNGGTSSASQSTTLISGLSMTGYLGVVDFSINNAGNGFDANGNANSRISYQASFNITNMDVNVNIMGVKLTGMKIADLRGDRTNIDGANAFGFAQVKGQMYAITQGIDPTINSATNLAALAAGAKVDGIGFDMNFKGDMDIGDISFGNTATSIGQVYLTDISFDTQMKISAH
jgi:hypothetical protein